MELAAAEGLEVVERSIGRMDLFAADEVFLTGSGAGRGGRAQPGWSANRRREARTRRPAQLALAHRALAEREGASLF